MTNRRPILTLFVICFYKLFNWMNIFNIITKEELSTFFILIRILIGRVRTKLRTPTTIRVSITRLKSTSFIVMLTLRSFLSLIIEAHVFIEGVVKLHAYIYALRANSKATIQAKALISLSTTKADL